MKVRNPRSGRRRAVEVLKRMILAISMKPSWPTQIAQLVMAKLPLIIPAKAMNMLLAASEGP